MRVIDVTLRESVYYGSGIDYAMALDYLKHMVKYIDNKDIQYVECGYLNTDEIGNLNYEEEYFCQAYEICKGHFELVAMMHPGKADMNKWSPQVIQKLSIVRITINGDEIPDSVRDYIDYLHSYGVKASVNIAYSLNKTQEQQVSMYVKSRDFGADYIYFADSSGSAIRSDICKLSELLKKYRGNNQIGLHLHNHLDMAFANALTIYEEGLDITDVSITGAGKGGGNLKTEMFIPYIRMIEKRELSDEFLINILEYIKYFDRIIGQYDMGHVKLFLDSLVGLYKIRLKKQEEIEKEANGDAHKYIRLIIEKFN